MEHMEQKAQMALDGAIVRERAIMVDGYKAGMWKAIEILRDGARGYEISAGDVKSVVEIHARQLAAALLRSWANGIEIEANKS